ncbi:MAG: hypothetical protein L3J09_08780 [Flavobacteriaceae bacterium]|nr:hypothetical protein [Flavobacteriaceae bacterium]
MMFKNLIKKFVKPFVTFIIKEIKKEDRSNREKAKKKVVNSFQSIGYGCRFNGIDRTILHPEKIIIGNNVHIGNNVFIHGAGGLIIGDNTHVSRNVTIYTVNHDYNDTALPYSIKSVYKSVNIGKNVWIGMNVSIVPGVNIGDGAIIGMGTVVSRNINDLEVVGSSKSRLLKKRDALHYKSLVENKQYGGVNGKLLESSSLEQFLPSYKDNKEKSIVFVLGTGRSGSTSIVDILNQHPFCKAFHEDIKQLIRLSTRIAQDKNNNDSFIEIENLLATKIWNATDDNLLIHSDQRFWNLVPFLSSYFPNSKFIHLWRNPINTVKSMALRGWYKDDEYPRINNHDWAKYRLQGDQSGGFTTKQWNDLNNIQKCTWYWVKVNKTIKNDLEKISSDRVLSIRLRDLDSNFDNLIKFLDVSPFIFENSRSNAGKHQDDYNSSIDSFILKEVEKYNFKIE